VMAHHKYLMMVGGRRALRESTQWISTSFGFGLGFQIGVEVVRLDGKRKLSLGWIIRHASEHAWEAAAIDQG